MRSLEYAALAIFAVALWASLIFVVGSAISDSMVRSAIVIEQASK